MTGVDIAKPAPLMAGNVGSSWGWPTTGLSPMASPAFSPGKAPSSLLPIRAMLLDAGQSAGGGAWRENHRALRCPRSRFGRRRFRGNRGKWGSLDFLVHALAFSDRNELKGRYADTTRDNFVNTMVISCFSFTEIAKRAAALMKNGGSMITLTYGG